MPAKERTLPQITQRINPFIATEQRSKGGDIAPQVGDGYCSPPGTTQQVEAEALDTGRALRRRSHSTNLQAELVTPALSSPDSGDLGIHAIHL